MLVAGRRVPSVFECCVVTPSLIPVRAGERVKTDRLDAMRQVRLLRVGELTPV